MAENVNYINLFCVDPFPGIDEIRAEFLEATSHFSNLRHFEYIDEFIRSVPEKMDVIHLDGEHTELAVSRDLEALLPSLAKDGVLIVDDIFYQDFPGVAFSTHNFISKHNLAPFLVSTSKIYLTYPHRYEYWYGKVRENLIDRSIRFYESQERTGLFTGYPQSNSINGFSVLVVKDKEFLTSETRKSLGINARVREPHQFLKLVIPPVLYKGLKRIKELLGRG